MALEVVDGAPIHFVILVSADNDPVLVYLGVAISAYTEIISIPTIFLDRPIKSKKDVSFILDCVETSS